MIKDNFLKNCAAPLGGSHGSQGSRGSQFGNHWAITHNCSKTSIGGLVGKIL